MSTLSGERKRLVAMNVIELSGPARARFARHAKAQVAILIALSLVLLYGAPRFWNYTPDSGVYLASALSMLADGSYTLSGKPNLLYYPGTSMVFSVPIAIFGLDFHVLQVYVALISVAVVWLARAVFDPHEWGFVGWLAPILLGLNLLFVDHAYKLLSDVIFVFLVLLAVLFWSRFERADSIRWLALCAVVAAIAPMVRFQGIFLVAAFGLALADRVVLQRRYSRGKGLLLLALGAATALPFLAWTLRNFVLHDPDTYNMANASFFGLSGLPQTGTGYGVPDWIDADWKFPVYQVMYLFGGLGESFVGEVGDKQLPVVAGGAIGLLLVGSIYWVRRTGVLELIFVLLNFVLLLHQFVGGESLYIVQRYWLPILPFLIVMLSMGVQRVFQGVGRFVSVERGRFALAAFAGLVVLQGSVALAHRISDEARAQIQEKYETAAVVTGYAKTVAPPDAVLMGSEWGVIPLLTGHQTVQIVRAPCPTRTFELIRRFGATHLVVVPDTLVRTFVDSIRQEYPAVFELEFSIGEEGTREFGGVYRINADAVDRAISRVHCER